MCGRFTSTTAPADLAACFGATEVVADDLGPRFNVAPTDEVYVVAESRGRGERHVAALRWGLVPSWAREPGIGSRMINARAETILESRAFRRSFGDRRCIIPVDGFYEWQALDGQRKKQPWYVTRGDGEVLALAGLWDSWRPAPGSSERLVSCTIITTRANDAIRPVHDRMPVVLPADAWDAWLDPSADDLDALVGLLVPAPPSLLTLTPVGTHVNDVRNDGPHLVEPVEPMERSTGTLF